jgi:SAM-dependent methyltransferase
MTNPGGFDHRQPLYDRYILNKKRRNKFSCSSRDYYAWASTTQSRVRDWLPAARNTPILDLGCGPGYFLYLLEKLVYT